MKNTDTGEFELVLGNRQLLSGFFIVVLLFGVAFAMGYIVGRNSSPSKLQTEATPAAAATSRESRAEPASGTPAASSPEPTPAPAAEAAPTSRETAPEKTESAAPAASRETTAAPAEAPAPAAAEAPPGSFWQVIATSNRTAAEALQQSLKDKGFPVTLGPGPNNLVRVLVGPYTDTQSMGRAKTQLEAAGLHPVRK
jgi:cell division septation protein DedD